jgi:hypothetical protein
MRTTYPEGTFIHIPNEGRHSETGLSWAYALGFKKGCADMLVLFKNRLPLWIEFKSKRGRQKPEQKVFEAEVKALGHQYHLCRSLEECKSIFCYFHMS